MVLGITGKFPKSVDELKAQGMYVEYCVKYGLYIVGGVTTQVGVWMGQRAIAARSRVTASIMLLALSAAVITATLGMSSWECYKDNQAGATAGSWVIMALTYLQRLAYLWFCGVTCFLFKRSSNAYLV